MNRERPCDGCALLTHCAKHDLQCRGFIQWAKQGAWSKRCTFPSPGALRRMQIAEQRLEVREAARERARIRNRQWDEQNPERRRFLDARWRAKHREERRARAKLVIATESAESRAQRLAKRRRAYREKYRDKALVYLRKWRARETPEQREMRLANLRVYHTIRKAGRAAVPQPPPAHLENDQASGTEKHANSWNIVKPARNSASAVR
jgi:hypothetical protein